MFQIMTNQQVWWKTSKPLIPPNLWHKNCTWVFENKHNGMYCTMLVAYGNSQIPGVNFLENSSLVMNDVTFLILLLITIHFRLSTKIVDIKTPFLWRELEEEIYMGHWPSIRNIGKDDCFLLKKSKCSLAHAARKYNKKAAEVL